MESPSLLKRPQNAKRAIVLGEKVALNFKIMLGKKTVKMLLNPHRMQGWEHVLLAVSLSQKIIQ